MMKQVKKGEILQRQGEFGSKIYFVRKGLLRSYSIDGNGKEHIFMFGPEGWTVADSTSPKAAATLFIDALEDSEIIVYEKKLFDDMNPDDKSGKRTISFIKRIEVLQKRVIMLMSSSAIERYEHFIETYPQIAQRVPQKMIASYLGITPEALSKVKGNKSRAQ